LFLSLTEWTNKQDKKWEELLKLIERHHVSMQGAVKKLAGSIDKAQTCYDSSCRSITEIAKILETDRIRRLMDDSKCALPFFSRFALLTIVPLAALIGMLKSHMQSRTFQSQMNCLLDPWWKELVRKGTLAIVLSLSKSNLLPLHRSGNLDVSKQIGGLLTRGHGFVAIERAGQVAAQGCSCMLSLVLFNDF
jgi:hypothetical protein